MMARKAARRRDAWREGAMPDVVNLISRVLLSAVFIVYGLFKFMDVSSITNIRH